MTLEQKTNKALAAKPHLRAAIAKEFDPEKTDAIWADAYDRLLIMYKDHSDLPKGVARHTDHAIFPAAAIYLAIKNVDETKAFAIMKEQMAIKAKEAGASYARMTRSSIGRKFFMFMWEKLSHTLFGEASGFKNVFYPEPKGCSRMDITECPYNKYLTKLGCPEINILFCENDIYTYGNLLGLKFTRTKTIGAGDELCDFKIEIEKGRA